MWRLTTVLKWISNDKFSTYHSNADDKRGDRKAFVAIIVANVAT
jgi:hypothetical protein